MKSHEVGMTVVEQQIGVLFAADYRHFLLRYGGCMAGPYPIFGLRPVEVMGTRRWSGVDY